MPKTNSAAFVRRFQRRSISATERFVAAVGVLVVLVALDFLPGVAAWLSAHPMTAATLTTLVFFVVFSMFFEAWWKERQALKLERISTVAYRSLAQCVNDIGRNLLVPVTGINITRLGIPQIWPESQADVDARLERVGRRLGVAAVTGSWNAAERDEFAALAGPFLEEVEFQHSLFLAAARGRRVLHDATAVWGTIMLVSSATAEDLAGLRDLTDALERLQELMRQTLSSSMAPDWQANAVEAYWHAIECYQRLRDDYGDKAALPSDVIVNRKANERR